MADFAMPQMLDIESTRKHALPAVRRQMIHDTTTQAEYRPGESCSIPIATGGAGCFMDTSATRLEMKITVLNKNYYTDAINLSRCGWHSVIKSMYLNINNGKHDEQLNYAECVEFDMIKMGENKTPVQMVRPNPYKLANGLAGDFHINFVKPSMVTNLGLPHNVTFGSISSNSASTVPDIISDNLLFRSNKFTRMSFGRGNNYDLFDLDGTTLKNPVYAYSQTGVSSVTAENSLGGFHSSNFPLEAGYWDDRIPLHNLTESYYRNDATFSTSSQFLSGTTIGPATNVTSQYRIVGTPVGFTSQLNRMSKNHAHKFDFTTNNTNTIYKVNYGQSVAESCAAQWPAKQPCDYHQVKEEFFKEFSKANEQNIQDYYANCKNIPIGIPLDLSGNDSGYEAIWKSGTHTKPSKTEYAINGAKTEFHVSLKVYSSLIGVLAKKAFPELLVPAGRMFLNIRFQESNIVFQTLMDPCRRVPGTCRDWFPYLGVVESKYHKITGGGTVVTTSSVGVGNLSTASATVIASGVHPVLVSDYVEGQVFNDAVAMGQFAIPQLRLKSMHLPYSQFRVDNYGGIDMDGSSNSTATFFQVDSLSKTTLSGAQNWVNYVPSSTDEIADKINYLYSLVGKLHYETMQNQEYGFPVKNLGYDTNNIPAHDDTNPNGDNSLQTDSSNYYISDLQAYSFEQDWRNYLANNVNTGTSGATIETSNPYYSSINTSLTDYQFKGLNWLNKCTPTPQFVPIKDPWNKSESRNIEISDFVSEDQMCFGTHLERSVMQVRRSHRSLYPLNISDSVGSKIDERLDYRVSNVRLITQQLVLPQTASDSILQAALSGGISMETQTWKTQDSVLPQAATQNALINIAAAFCTHISFLFRPFDTIQGDQAYGYNSLSFVCPFTSFRFDLDTTMTDKDGNPPSRADDYNNLGGKPVYTNALQYDDRILFDIQLVVQNEYLPRQAIDSLSLLHYHTRHGDDVYSSADYLGLHPAMQPSGNTNNGMIVDTLQDGYYACHIPISCLDDQTITCNPFYTPLEISLRKKIRGNRANRDALPLYKPLDGTFHLSFNLESFMGQSGRMRTGIPIVNNNMFLRFKLAHLCAEYSCQLLTIATVDGRIMFERGGTFNYYT